MVRASVLFLHVVKHIVGGVNHRGSKNIMEHMRSFIITSIRASSLVSFVSTRI